MIGFLFTAITYGAVLMFGCLGELLTEKSGHLNLGIPGIMCMGAAGACFGVKMAMSMGTPVGFVVVLFAMIFAMIFAAIMGALYAIFTVSLRVNQNVVGLTITLFGNAFSTFLINDVVIAHSEVNNQKIIEAGLGYFGSLIPAAGKAGGIVNVLFGHSVLVYLAIILCVVAGIMLRKSRVGLNLRSIGESPATADAVGINVTGYKYCAILIGSAIAGLGGLSYIMGIMRGIIGSEISSTIEGFGWMAVALVIFSLWKPEVAIFTSILFGGLYICPVYITGISFQMMKLVNVIPYVVTIIVLIATSIAGKKEFQAPASLGLPYFREER